MRRMEIYTDGSCFPNPGSGGWAYVILENGKETEMSGSDESTTSNRMELYPAIAALNSLGTEQCRVTVYSDSQYLCRPFNLGWLDKWARSGRLYRDDKPNMDMWRELRKLDGLHLITWIHVRGHSGNKYNERCDYLAELARRQMVLDNMQSQINAMIA